MRKIILFLIFGLALAFAAVLFLPQKPYKSHEVSVDYQAQIDRFYVPPLPPDWQWSLFSASDGTNLRWGETGNRGTSDITILIIPGYTATLKMYGEHVDLLAERGFHVMGLDLRGQGGSDRHFPKQPERLWVEDFSTYSDDVAEFVRSQNFSEDRIVIPMAMSFGGHVALRSEGDHPGLFDALFLLAPAIVPKAGDLDFDQALKIMNFMRKMGKADRYVPGGGNWKPFGEDIMVAGIELCSSNPKRLYLRDAIFTNNVTERVGDVINQWGAEFYESSLYVREPGYLEAIDIPILMVSAEVDNFVDTEENIKACNNRLPNCENKTYEGAGHCLPQESDELIEDMFDRLEALAASL